MSIVVVVVVVVFFLDIVSPFLMTPWSDGQSAKYRLFLLFGWKWQCVHPFRWVFQDKAQSCYFPFLFLTFTNQSFWNINNVLELLYVNFLFQSDFSERLWKITGIVFGFLNFRLQHLWTFPRNGSGLWFSSSSSKNSFSQVTCFGVLEIRGIFTCRDNPDGYDRYFLHLFQDEWRIILHLIFSPFVSHGWLHIKLLFRSLACKEEAVSWRPVFLIFICKTLFWFFFSSFNPLCGKFEISITDK